MNDSESTKGYFTPVRIVFWFLMASILIGVAALWIVPIVTSPDHRGSDRARCMMNQRSIQMAVRVYQDEHQLKAGDPVPWDKLIGPGNFLEAKPSCPVHGVGAYQYSKVFPEAGVLAAPCQDPQHRPQDIKDW